MRISHGDLEKNLKIKSKSMEWKSKIPLDFENN